MSPLSRKIEDRAITALLNIINNHPTMDHNISRKDKELSWDGYIRLFQNDDCSNDKYNYDCDVSIQVKGHVDNERKIRNSERIKENVDLDDLYNYFRMNGCIYFVIYENEDGSDVEIFYSSMYPSKIKKYLELAEKKGNKHTIKVPFVKMKKDYMFLYGICKQFNFEVSKQGSGLGQIVPKAIQTKDLGRVKKLTASIVGATSPYGFFQRVNDGDVVFYGTIDDSEIQYPMQIDMMVSGCQVVDKPVLVGGTQYYSSYKLSVMVTGPDNKDYNNDGNIEVQLSNNLILKPRGKEVSIYFQLNSDIMHLKKDSEFIRDLVEKKEIVFGDFIVPIEGLGDDKSIFSIIYKLIEMGETLEEVGCNLDVPYKELTSDDFKQIELLCDIRSGRKFIKSNEDKFVYYWSIRNKQWPIFVNRNESKISISDYMYNTCLRISLYQEKDGEQRIKEENEIYVVPNFIQMEPRILANLFYYDYESMYEQVEKAEINDITVNELNMLALNLISSYDICEDKRLLEIANILLNRINMLYPDNMNYLVNICQIEFRKNGEISQDRINELEEMIPKAKMYSWEEKSIHFNMENIFLYCISILKHEEMSANDYYNNLSKEEKELVETWPIRTLHLNLIN